MPAEAGKKPRDYGVIGGGAEPTKVLRVDPAGETPVILSAEIPQEFVDPDLQMPDVVGGFQILGELGRGGMGIVYRGYDTRLKRPAAIKMLWAGQDATEFERSRFNEEAELIAALQHPNVVQVYETGVHMGRPFLVMELIDGGSLEKHTGGKPQPPRQAAEIIETLARAVHAAHQQGIIHRDLKPANVLLTPGGVLKITDFGLAKRVGESRGSKTGEVLGTANYMAPEQAGGKNRLLGHGVDVYALGAMLYELLTGRPPFQGVTFLDTIEQVRKMEPPPPSRLVPRLPRDLTTICLHCLEKKPDKRYQSAEELANELRRWLKGEPIHARPLSRMGRAFRAVRRRPTVALFSAMASIAIVQLVMLAVAERERRIHESIADQERSYRLQMGSLFETTRNTLEKTVDRLLQDPVLKKRSDLDHLLRDTLTEYEDLIAQQAGRDWIDRGHIAGAYEKIGQLKDRIGDQVGAADAYGKARGVLATLGVAGDDESREHRIARLTLKRGRLLFDVGHMQDARTELERARDQMTRLCQRQPDRPEWQNDLAEVWHTLGEFHDTAGERQTAVDAFVEARRIRTALVANYAGDLDGAQFAGFQRDLARTHGFLGDVELDLSMAARAEMSYHESQRLRAELNRRSPEDLHIRWQYARSIGNFGRFFAQVPAYSFAVGRFEESRSHYRELIAADGMNVDYKTDLAYANCRLAALNSLRMSLINQGAQGELKTKIRTDLDEAIAVLEPLYRADPGLAKKKALMRYTLGEAYCWIATVTIDEDVSAARRSLAKAQEILEPLAKDRKDSLELMALAAVYAMQAEVDEPNAEGLRVKATAQVAEAIRYGYRLLNADDVPRLPAFRGIKDRPEFQQATAKMKSSVGKPTGS